MTDALLATVAFLVVVTVGARIHARLGHRPASVHEPELDEEYDTRPIRRSVLQTARARIVPAMTPPVEKRLDMWQRITERNHGEARWN